MIRRDYFLRMIEEFAQMLAKLDSYKRGQNWEQATETLDEGFQRLIGSGAEAVSHLSETELLAKVIQGEPTQIVHQKTLFLTSLLKEAGDVAAAQDRAEESRSCYLKGLHLLLQTLGQNDESDFPDFVPKVDAFVLALSDSPLPLETNALLMQHYERTGQFDKAEDALFAMADLEPANPAITEFGICFYERLLGHSDAALAGAGLPRPEVEAGLSELRERANRRLNPND
jgi:hypothetical protein